MRIASRSDKSLLVGIFVGVLAACCSAGFAEMAKYSVLVWGFLGWAAAMALACVVGAVARKFPAGMFLLGGALALLLFLLFLA